MKSCYCFIRHAITDEERKQAKKALDIAYQLGDSTGIIIGLAALSPCPERKENKNDTSKNS